MKYFKNLAILLSLALSLSANAAIITYEVSDANNNNGDAIGHGLYTFGKNETGSAKYSIQTNTFFTINTDTLTATLIGTAKNLQGRTATIDLAFSGFVETNNYKKENGKIYNPGVHDILNTLAAEGNGDIDFFETISGSISIDSFIDGTRLFDISTCTDCGGTTDPYGLQFGDGANAKSATDFGGSAWIGVGPTHNKSSHWDLNLSFSNPVTVPEPSTPALLAIGLIFLARLRKTS